MGWSCNGATVRGVYRGTSIDSGTSTVLRILWYDRVYNTKRLPTAVGTDAVRTRYGRDERYILNLVCIRRIVCTICYSIKLDHLEVLRVLQYTCAPLTSTPASLDERFCVRLPGSKLAATCDCSASKHHSDPFAQRANSTPSRGARALRYTRACEQLCDCVDN